MQKIILILIFFLTISKSFSQSYIPIPADSSSLWRVQIQDWEPFPWWMRQNDLMYYFEGDTIIGSYTYKKLYASGIIYIITNLGTTQSNYAHEYKGCIRNDNQKVYFNPGYQDYLLYDFTIQAGNYLPVTYINDTGIIVSSIDSVLVGTEYRKRFNLTGPPGSLVANWIIEGLGHEWGLIEILFMTPDHGSSLECYAENSTPIYPPGAVCDLTIGIEETSTFQNKITVFPNPSSGKFSMKCCDMFVYQINYQITKVTGELVSQGICSFTNGFKEFDLSFLSNGMYIISFQNCSSGTNKVSKLFINK